jgi:dephospho-CoA kinase
MTRSGLSEKQILSRINAQLSNKERIKRAKVVIHNDGTTEDLRKQVKKLWDNLDAHDCA